MRCNACFRCSKDGQVAVIAFTRGTTTARLTLVARLRNILEVDATRTLQQIATGCGKVAQLARGTREQRLREHRVARANRAIGSQIAVAYSGTDTRAPIRKPLVALIWKVR